MQPAMNRQTFRSRVAFAAPLLLAAGMLSSSSGCGPSSTVEAVAPSVPTTASAAPAAAAALPADLAEIFARAEREAGGHLGVALLHVESGERFSYHGTERFPMQSVFKLPLAIEVL